MKPTSRKENLVVQDLDNELFIYDLENDKVFSLNETSAFIWNKLDGKTPIAELVVQFSGNFDQPADEELVWLAIDDLRKSNLLEKENLPKAMSKVERREAIKRIGLASMIALPMISMLIAPTALHAQSGGTAAVCQPCVTTADCASPATCKPGFFGGLLCALNSNSSTSSPGAATITVDISSCNSYGATICCSGTATFTAGTGFCACN